MPAVTGDFDQLVRRAEALCQAPDRCILGIAGCPGSGKSTLAMRLAQALDPSGERVARVPMDGFHLADAQLDRLGRRARKGAIDTFDADGYLALLRRLRTDLDQVIYAPDFDRALEQPIAGSIAVAPVVRLVITEGNYLLTTVPPWPLARRELAEVWYCQVPEEIRLRRLIGRHVRFGKPPRQARRWVAEVDEPNARLIEATRPAADLLVTLSV